MANIYIVNEFYLRYNSYICKLNLNLILDFNSFFSIYELFKIIYILNILKSIKIQIFIKIENSSYFN